MSGKLIIICAPSGAGKTTLVNQVLSAVPHTAFSISATSRAKRANEAHGQDYYFMSAQEFRKKIEENAFLEWEEVYSNQFYGTLKSEVAKLRKQGKHVVFDVDVEGGINLKNYFGKDAFLLFIQPPSLEILAERLRKRATETEDAFKMRLAKAEYELQFAHKADDVVVNDHLETAKQEIVQKVNAFLAS